MEVNALIKTKVDYLLLIIYRLLEASWSHFRNTLRSSYCTWACIISDLDKILLLCFSDWKNKWSFFKYAAYMCIYPSAMQATTADTATKLTSCLYYLIQKILNEVAALSHHSFSLIWNLNQLRRLDKSHMEKSPEILIFKYIYCFFLSLFSCSHIMLDAR